MTTLPVAEVRAQLSLLVEEATSTHERVAITRNGQRVAVLIGADDYDALRETIAVLGDAELPRAHAEGTAALHAGDSLDANGLGQAMREAGRLPSPEWASSATGSRSPVPQRELWPNLCPRRSRLPPTRSSSDR